MGVQLGLGSTSEIGMTGEFEGEDSEVLRRKQRRPPIDMLLVVEREVRTADSTNRTAKLLLGRSRWGRSVDLSVHGALLVASSISGKKRRRSG